MFNWNKLFIALGLVVLTSSYFLLNQPNINRKTKHGELTQLAQYVVDVFEDSKGSLWFGTLEKGVAKYDGRQLKYYTTKDGLPSNRVTGVIENSEGTLWLNTGSGLSQFDGKTFTNYTINSDFQSNSISCLLIDSKNNFWVGTWNGVYQFDGKSFKSFEIPFPQVSTKINDDTKNWITVLKEDSLGNLWFARDGYGLCKYDGKSFTHLLKKDGIYSNNVTDIEFDSQGHLWVATRVAEKDNPDPNKRMGDGGINKFDGNKFISFPKIAGINRTDVYELYKDKSNKIWIGTTKNGVYKFDGKDFEHFQIPIATMGILDDSKNNIWVCGAGGVYRINPKGKIRNITTDGIWE